MFLTQAETIDDAKYNVTTFLAPYDDSKVWDWFVIGGRWSGLLVGKDENNNRDTYKDNPCGDDILPLHMCREYVEKYIRHNNSPTIDEEQEQRTFLDIAWDCDVYNIEDETYDRLPPDDNYRFAVVVDMHN